MDLECPPFGCVVAPIGGFSFIMEILDKFTSKDGIDIIVFKKNGIVYVKSPSYKHTVSCYDFLALAMRRVDESDAFSFARVLDKYCVDDDVYWDLRLAVMHYIIGCENRERYSDAYNGIKTYLMLDSNTEYTKIGKAKNPQKRERTLQSEKPTISLIKVCETLVESELHKKYADKRVRVEWFNLSEQDISDIVKEYDFHDVK